MLSKFYRFLLALMGLVILAAAAWNGFHIGQGVISRGGLGPNDMINGGFVALLFVLSLPLVAPRLSPGFLQMPSRVVDGVVVGVVLSLIVGGAFAADLYRQALVLEQAPAFAAMLDDPLFLAAMTVVLTVAFLALFIGLKVARQDRMRAPAAQPSSTSEPTPGSGLTRALVSVAMILSMILSVLAAGTLAYAKGYLPAQPVVPILQDNRLEDSLSLLAFILAAQSILPIYFFWGHAVWPFKLVHVIRRAVLLLVIVGPALYLAERMIPGLLPAPFDQVHAMRFQLAGGLTAIILVLSAIIMTRSAKLMHAATESAASAPVAEATMPPTSHDNTATASRRGAKLNKMHTKTASKAVDVPDVGILMKMYRITDWLLLRLCGAALLGMAWMIYTAGDDNLWKVGAILYGIAPKTVMIVYAVWGALLLLPALLPRVISRPQTVLGGAVKAAVLVGLAFLIMPALDAAIDLYVPKDYRGVLHASVPRIFKAVAGIAVFSAMAIALFRQLGGSAPVLDGMGRPAQRFSADELRSLRAARMGS